MKTFKQYLLEGGNATKDYNVSRVTSDDVRSALDKVSKALNIPYKTLEDDLLGSTKMTLIGKKKDSGDIDIALSAKEYNALEINKKMLNLCNNEGEYNAGTKVGSYAVPLNNKKVQVDLMFVSDKVWAKWVYSSSVGDKSKYPGAVRNIILFTALAHTQKDGEDFVIRDDDNKAIIRASKSITMDNGMKRLFKMAKKNKKTGELNKSIETVTPEEIELRLKELGKNIKFSKETDFTNNPDDIAKHIFGEGVKANNLLTAEDVILQIKKLPNANKILQACKKELQRINLTVPEEL